MNKLTKRDEWGWSPLHTIALLTLAVALFAAAAYIQ